MKTQRCSFLAICTLALFMLPSQVLAAKGLGGSFGLGYLPMTDWRNLFEPSKYSDYRDSKLGLYLEFYAKASIHDRGALALSLERISRSALNRSSAGGFHTDFGFSSLPISLTYELQFRRSAARTTPFVGLGAGAYYSVVKTTTTIYHFPSDPSLIRGERKGWGYGLHAYLGHRTAVSQVAAVFAKVRARWADGMYFSDDKDDIDVDFTGLDVTIGIEYSFR